MTEKQTPKKAMPVSPGRPKGIPNRTTQTLKEAILLAAERVGSDGKGGDGLTGYLVHVAQTDVKAFSALLGKVLPMQVTGEDGGPIQVTIKQFVLPANASR